MTHLETFLDALLLDALPDDVDYVFCVQDDAPSDTTPWPPINETAMLRKMRGNGALTRAAYMSTQISRRGDDGRFRNRQGDFYALHMIVLDDIGAGDTSKVSGNTLEPTYKIETSPGNFQWGYVFEQPVTDLDLARRLVATIYGEGALTDGGGRLVNKFVRLPVGINGKQRAHGRDTHPVTLTELHPDRLFTPDALLAGLGLTLVDGVRSTFNATGNAAAAGLGSVDRVLDWLAAHGHVLQDTGDEWVTIRCPWHHTHTTGGDSAGYVPLGRGNSPDHRAFNCHHAHCAERKTPDLLDWVEDQGGPRGHVFDPIAILTARYVLLEHSSEVADVTAAANEPYPIVALSAFRAAHRQYLLGERGGKQYYGELWLESPDTVRCKGRVYQPGGPVIVDVNGKPHFNTYRVPCHVPRARLNGAATPTAYLEHINWLIPDDTERELFHDWVAKKLQSPTSRSYAIVMVADLLQGQDGQRYGTGRSTVGDILGRVFQSGVAKIDLTDVTGKGDSQSAYNDWADGCQLAIIEETKEEVGSWRVDHAAYEGLKKVIDTRPVPGVRVKPKYGKIYTTTLYSNFLFFTNHSDALQLPHDDRRVCVLDNAKGRRTFKEYGELHDFLHCDRSIAGLYYWYMARDVSQFDHIYPPMTAAKMRMVKQSVTPLDDIWERAIAMLPGAVATKSQLRRACEMVADEDDGVLLKIPGMVSARWKRLVRSPNEDDFIFKFEGRSVRARIIHRADEVMKSHFSEGVTVLREEISLNHLIVSAF